MKRRYFLSKCNSVYHQNGLAPSFLDGVLSIETRKNEEERGMKGLFWGGGTGGRKRRENRETKRERELPLRRQYSTFSITFFSFTFCSFGCYRPLPSVPSRRSTQPLSKESCTSSTLNRGLAEKSERAKERARARQKEREREDIEKEGHRVFRRPSRQI